MKHIACLSLFSSSMACVAEHPNIICVFTNQHTANTMSCTGDPDVHTPNLDRLAAAGVMSRNTYCMAPLSGPSRGAMLAGHYPGSVELLTNGTPLPEALQTQTLDTLAKSVGYECAYGGEWHVPELDIPDEVRGFDQIHRYSDDGLAEACVQFLLCKHDRPFFLIASHDNPHNICEYAHSQGLPYGSMEIPEIHNCPGPPPNFAKNPYDADVVEEEKDNNFSVYPTTTFAPEDWRMYRHTYYRLVEKIDREVGKIIDVIDKDNLWKNIVVILSSDHGDGTGTRHQNQKSALYEEVVSVPLIVTLPGKKYTDEKLPQLISDEVDFFATICDWTKAEKSENTTGKSFHKIAEEDNPQAPHQNYAVIEARFDGNETRGWVVRTERYKYVLYDKGRHHEQLFDMQNNKGETRNLMMEDAYEEVAQQHRSILENYMNTYKIKPTRPRLHDVPGRTIPEKANFHSSN